jgi:hypothetical protein
LLDEALKFNMLIRHFAVSEKKFLLSFLLDQKERKNQGLQNVALLLL